MWFKEVTSSITWCHPYLLSESEETLVFLLNSECFGAPLEPLRQVRLLHNSSTPQGAWFPGAAHNLQAGAVASLSLPLSSMSPQNLQASPFAQNITSVSDIVPLGSNHGATITSTRCRLSCWPCLWINAWRANHNPGCDFGKGDPKLCVA